MSTLQMLVPRTVKAAPDPPGWYVRPSYIDHRAITDAVAGGSVGLHGVVFDPSHEDRHSELRDLARISHQAACRRQKALGFH